MKELDTTGVSSVGRMTKRQRVTRLMEGFEARLEASKMRRAVVNERAREMGRYYRAGELPFPLYKRGPTDPTLERLAAR